LKLSEYGVGKSASQEDRKINSFIGSSFPTFGLPDVFLYPVKNEELSTMFNLFKKKEDSVKVIDKIWMSQESKWKGILNLWRKDPELIIITWFNETHRRLTGFFAPETSSAPVLLAREVHASQIKGKPIIFSEHYPMRRKEQDSFKQWQLTQAIVHSAMDEPIFLHFGGEKILGMMKQLGMKEDNVIEHKLISNSIENAQEKIEKKVVAEQLANSQKEWIERNL
jgi:hypothetical protein